MEKRCGCKGCRSCLLCETINNKIAEQNIIKERQFYTLFYNKDSGHCISPMTTICCDLNEEMKSLIGFDFPGVTIVSNFLSDSEEANLVKEIDNCQWKTSQSGRCKQDYGPKVNFKKQKIKLSTFNGLPAYILKTGIIHKMKELPLLQDFYVVEQCNLEYLPERGSHIEPHFDDDWLWGERLVTLNLLSDSWLTMSCDSDELCELYSYSSEKVDKTFFNQKRLSNFCNKKKLSYNVIKVKIPLQRCSLLVLHGPARHKWKHAIEREDITSRRLCCTFRELSTLFLDGGEKSDIGKEVLVIASSFSGTVVL